MRRGRGHQVLRRSGLDVLGVLPDHPEVFRPVTLVRRSFTLRTERNSQFSAFFTTQIRTKQPTSSSCVTSNGTAHSLFVFYSPEVDGERSHAAEPSITPDQFRPFSSPPEGTMKQSSARQRPHPPVALPHQPSSHCATLC